MNRQLLDKLRQLCDALLRVPTPGDPNGRPLQLGILELDRLLDQVSLQTDVPSTAWAEYAEARGVVRDHATFASETLIREALQSLQRTASASLALPSLEAPQVFGFIEDAAFREALMRDYWEAERALSEGMWKSAAVLMGSVLEAAVAWRLDALWTSPSRDEGAETNRRWLRSRSADLKSILERASKCDLIERDYLPALQAGVVDQRNLIHPLAEVRAGVRVDGEAARAAKAMVDAALRDLRASSTIGPPSSPRRPLPG